MEEEPASPRENKADALLALVKGPLAASAARLSAHSRAVPAGRDFHFYRNFEQFGSPAREVAARSGALLTSIGSSEIVCGVGKHEDESEQAGLPEDLDDAHDWVVSVNDEILERFNASMDEFRSLREDEERGTVADRVATMEAGGFQIVQGKKSKKNKKNGGVEDGVEVGGVLGVKVASRDKKTSGPRSQVPFHIPTIPRPQDAFKILVNNSNQPFEHVWLERSKDGSQFVHPLEKLSVLDFIDGNVGEDEPMKPPPLEDTPFKFVEDVKGLKELAAKLRAVNEFSVDLEHNQYRSFQGLTCLMQISTRTEDFIVDTLKLRIHVGPHLREVFKDPSKRKVMHGADRDILWLQRDFGIYVCNLFDTGQASRVMQLERNSLEYLLQYFCGVTANKEYQQADWRLRPLPEEMIKYAREDTHYLLFMYDVMRRQLLSGSSNHELSDSLLAEVYRRSSDICMQLYEKELLTDTSFLRIYGLSEADFNSQQIAIVAGLWEWRDCISRAEDESTGYILPNKALLEIARRMPLTSGALRQLVKSKHPYVERNLSAVVAVIRNAVTNAAAFQPIVDRLKQATETPHGGAEEQAAAAAAAPALMTSTLPLPSSAAETPQRGTGESTMAAAVFVEKKEKPAGAFGALFGGSAVKRKVTHLVNGGRVQGGAEAKLEQIRASVALPFHSFMGGAAVAQPPETMDNCREEPPSAAAATITIAAAGEQLGDVIPLASSPDEMPERNGGEENEEEPPSLPAAERGSAGCGTSPEWEPFDYAAARKEVRFGGRREEAKEPAAEAESGGGPPSGRRRGGGGADESDLSAPRRCQAYPPSGNRSATFH